MTNEDLAAMYALWDTTQLIGLRSAFVLDVNANPVVQFASERVSAIDQELAARGVPGVSGGSEKKAPTEWTHDELWRSALLSILWTLTDDAFAPDAQLALARETAREVLLRTGTPPLLSLLKDAAIAYVTDPAFAGAFEGGARDTLASPMAAITRFVQQAEVSLDDAPATPRPTPGA